MHGLLVFPPNLDAKVREADKIEQEGVLYYRYEEAAVVLRVLCPRSPLCGCRCVVPVYPDGGEESVTAYVYVRDVTDSCAVPVPTGDWVTCDKTELTGVCACACLVVLYIVKVNSLALALLPLQCPRCVLWSQR